MKMSDLKKTMEKERFMKMSDLKQTWELDAMSQIDALKIAIANGYFTLDPSFLVETLRQMDHLKKKWRDELDTVPKFESWDTSFDTNLIDQDRLAGDEDRYFDVSRHSEDWQFNRRIATNICNRAKKLQDEFEKFRYPNDETFDWRENWCHNLETLVADITTRMFTQ